MTTKECAKRLKDARMEKGMSQKELALRVGLSDRTISAYEKGTFYPPVANLLIISRILGKKVSFFIEP